MNKMKGWRKKMRMKRKEGKRARKLLLNHLRWVSLVLMNVVFSQASEGVIVSNLKMF